MKVIARGKLDDNYLSHLVELDAVACSDDDEEEYLIRFVSQ